MEKYIGNVVAFVCATMVMVCVSSCAVIVSGYTAIAGLLGELKEAIVRWPNAFWDCYGDIRRDLMP